MTVARAAVEIEPHAAELLGELRETRAALADEFPGARFLAFWDLDGTLLRGDCSEGLASAGRVVYPGLVQLAIERGLSADYPADGGFFACRDDYALLRQRFGSWLAFPFLAQIFAGAYERELVELARAHFGATLQRFYFSASRLLFDGLAADGVEQHVLSASADFFVRGAAATLKLPPANLHGIRVRVDDGRLTRDPIAPVTTGEGKRARLLEIVRAVAAQAPARRVFVLAAFGDSYATDGAFLAHVAQQMFPAGRPLAVMINAGIPPAEYRRLFRTVRQTRVVGDA